MTQYELVSQDDRHLTDEFLKELSVQIKSGTQNFYKGALGLFYLCLDDKQISLAKKARRNHIVHWLNELSIRKYAESTKIHHIFCIRLYLTWLYERGHSRKEPSRLILPQDLPKLPRKFPRPIPPEADQKLIEFLTGSEDLMDRCLLLLRWTGFRISDLVSLEYKPIRDDGHGHQYLQVYANKLDREYVVPIDDKTAELILSLQDHAMQWATVRDSQGNPLRLINDPKGRDPRPLIRQHLASLSPLITDKNITPHQLRHTYATSLVNAGMGLFSVMKLLGHVDIRMTLRYAELYPTRLHSEYHSAIKKVTEQYEIRTQSDAISDFDPRRSLDDLVNWLRTHYGSQDKSILRLMKRTSKLKSDITALRN